MTITVQISCINKTSRMNPHERIRSVGGVNSDGSNWKLSLEDAIKGVKDNEYKFWTVANRKSVWVVIATSAHGYEYLKTEADGDQPNNLLSLRECP